MTNHEIKQVLINNNVSHLYHTNTVETTISFLRNKGLLSRELCERLGFPQTDQYTDMIDKEYSIYNDIFFDSMEIQRRTGVSYYGPVLFVYNIDVLDTIEEGHIRITKQNPESWRNTANDSERYFNDLDELSIHFEKGNFGQHITLTNQNRPLSFDHLEKIVLSDPQKEDNYLFDEAKASIQNIITNNKLNIALEVRDYCYYRRFFETYSNPQKLYTHFSLGGHIR